ncbi:MAG: L-serine ammonia-lyase, iron-sulfur-dependent, subunit alpha [Candidatus Hodarchaeales archaeon]
METTLKQLNRTEQKLNQVLLEDIQPYLGCTDISIIALGAALAAQAAFGFVPFWVDSSKKQPFTKMNPEKIVSIALEMNEGLYKSAHAAVIPNSGGPGGIQNSVALGVLCNPEAKLNLFDSVDKIEIEKMEDIASLVDIDVKTVHNPACNLFLHTKITVRTEQGITTGESLLQNGYSKVAFLKRDGLPIFESRSESSSPPQELSELNLPTLIEALNHLSPEVYNLLEETINLNTRAYEHGLINAPGLGIGAKFNRMMERGMMGSDAANQAASKTAAAEDVRMGGENVAVMGVASSGSHGIMSSIPIIVVAENHPKERKKLLRSIALSFWITQKIKERTGFLSAPCGCVISSGIGATAGITYFMDGTVQQIEQAINYFIISTAGVICDGGKTTCSIKLANAASTAVQSAFLSLEGIKISKETGGIVRENLQQNIENLVGVSKGMQDVDRVIVDILKQY